MTRVVIRGESVYECDVCKRRERVPTNRQGLDVMPRCNITAGCKGSLHRVTALRDISNTPSFPPEVEGVSDWFQRNVLYTHQQPIRSDTWVVNHNLQNIPILHIFVTRETAAGTTLEPYDNVTTTIVDANTLIVHFPSAQSGQVQCVSLVSKNVVNYTSRALQPETSIPASSSTGEITIATLATDALVDIQIKFSTAVGTTAEYVGIDDVPSIQSAWAGVDAIIVNGRRYVVRSFNIVNGSTASLFSTGVIPSGTSFTISKINGTQILPNQVLILLSNPPHTFADRIYDKCIDTALVNTSAPELYYTAGTAEALSTIVRPTYPLILVV